MGDFELGARLFTYGVILSTFGGGIINNINYDEVSVTKNHHMPARQGLVNDDEDNYDVSLQHV